jgi:hypothetical protein
MTKYQTTVFLALVLLAAVVIDAATVRSPAHSTRLPIAPAGIVLKELAVDIQKLPIEDFDDQSLVYSTGTKH